MTQMTHDQLRETLFGALPGAEAERSLLGLLAIAQHPRRPAYAPEEVAVIAQYALQLAAEDARAAVDAMPEDGIELPPGEARELARLVAFVTPEG